MPSIIYTIVLLFLTISHSCSVLAMEDTFCDAYFIEKNSNYHWILEFLNIPLICNAFTIEKFNSSKKEWEPYKNYRKALTLFIPTYQQLNIKKMVWLTKSDGTVVVVKKDGNNFIKIQTEGRNPFENITSLTTIENRIHNKSTTNSFLPSEIKKLIPRNGLLQEIIAQHLRQTPSILYKVNQVILAEAALSWLIKKYLLDNWVISIKETDSFFKLAAALNKSNSNLSIVGPKGVLGIALSFYIPNILYKNHYCAEINTKPFLRPLLQIIRTQLLGLAYQTIAPKEYQDGWFAGPVGQFVFEQAAITAARTNPYGICSWIGAELIAGYSPNVTQSTWEKQFKKIVVRQARTSTVLDTLRDLHTPLQTLNFAVTQSRKQPFLERKAPTNITKFTVTTLFTAALHFACNQTPCKKRLKELKTTNPNVAWWIKKTGQYGVPFAADMLFERFVN